MSKFEMIVNIHIQDFPGPAGPEPAKEVVEAYLTHCMSALSQTTGCKATVTVEHIEEQEDG